MDSADDEVLGGSCSMSTVGGEYCCWLVFDESCSMITVGGECCC